MSTLPDENVDGVGEGLVEAMPATDETGRDPKTPFMTLSWVTVGVAAIVAVVIVLAFVIPYLVNGHWPL